MKISNKEKLNLKLKTRETLKTFPCAIELGSFKMCV